MKIKTVLAAAALSAAVVSGSALAETVVGVTWFAKSSMAERILQGMQERNEELGNPITLKIDHTKKDNEEARARTQQFLNEGVNGVAVLRSAGGTLMKEMGLPVPGFIGAHNHPERVGSIENMDAPEGNITGVTYFLPYKVQLDTFRNIANKMDRVGILTEEGHPAAPVTEAGVMAYCKENGMTCMHKSVSDIPSLVAAVEEMDSQVDAFVLGNQRDVYDQTPTIAEHTDKPLFSFSKKGAELGALAAFAADDNKLGRYLTDSIVDVLINGKAVKDVPVKTDEDPVLYVNMTTAGKLGVEVPYEILSTATIIE